MFRVAVSRALPIASQTWGRRSYFLDRSDTEKRVMDCVKNFQKVPADLVKPGAHFINDLGLDSLDQVEVVMSFEQEFLIDIPDNEAEKILTVDDATEYIANHPQAR